jgi:hypothetical protein
VPVRRIPMKIGQLVIVQINAGFASLAKFATNQG